MHKDDFLVEFHFLTDFLGRRGVIRDTSEYKRTFSAFLSHAFRLYAYTAIAPVCKGDRVLDVGCFLGHGGRILSEHAEEVVGVDSDKEALDAAQERTEAANVQFTYADGRHLPYPEGQFDVVTAFQVIEHVPVNEVESFLREISRVLSSKGRAFVTTPNRKFRLLPLQKPFNLEHHQEFTARSLSQALSAVFPQVEVRGVRAQAWMEAIERRRVRRSPWRVYVKAPISRAYRATVPSVVTDLIDNRFPRDVRRRRRRAKRSSMTGPDADDKAREFESLFERFQEDDFFLLEGIVVDKSVDLIALCRRGQRP